MDVNTKEGEMRERDANTVVCVDQNAFILFLFGEGKKLEEERKGKLGAGVMSKSSWVMSKSLLFHSPF